MKAGLHLRALGAKEAFIKGLAQATANSDSPTELISKAFSAGYSEGVRNALDAFSAELEPLSRR